MSESHTTVSGGVVAGRVVELEKKQQIRLSADRSLVSKVYYTEYRNVTTDNMLTKRNIPWAHDHLQMVPVNSVDLFNVVKP